MRRARPQDAPGAAAARIEHLHVRVPAGRCDCHGKQAGAAGSGDCEFRVSLAAPLAAVEQVVPHVARRVEQREATVFVPTQRVELAPRVCARFLHGVDHPSVGAGEAEQAGVAWRRVEAALRWQVDAPSPSIVVHHALLPEAAQAVVRGEEADLPWQVPVSLHERGVDFAAWCSYKYLNSAHTVHSQLGSHPPFTHTPFTRSIHPLRSFTPQAVGAGCLAPLFVHEKHARDSATYPRLSGWWGVPFDKRFEMAHEYDEAAGAAAFGVSNVYRYMRRRYMRRRYMRRASVTCVDVTCVVRPSHASNPLHDGVARHAPCPRRARRHSGAFATGEPDHGGVRTELAARVPARGRPAAPPAQVARAHAMCDICMRKMRTGG